MLSLVVLVQTFEAIPERLKQAWSTEIVPGHLATKRNPSQKQTKQKPNRQTNKNIALISSHTVAQRKNLYEGQGTERCSDTNMS